MRAYLPAYDLKVPRDLGEALMLLERDPDVWQPFAGGTDLMVLLEAGKLSHKRFLSLWHLAELRGIEETPDHVTLGALTTYTQVLAHATLQREFPMLCQAARETGGIATQNRGTLAGNIANASPAADSPPALLVYDAQLELVSARGSRWVPYLDFHTGYKEMIMRPAELIRRIRLSRLSRAQSRGSLPRGSGPRPVPTGTGHYYRKVGTRKAQAISKVCFAGLVQMDGNQIQDIRIALGSVAPTVIRCAKTEALLKGQKLNASAIAAARAELSREIAPIDDFRSTAAYRLRVAANLLEEFLLTLPR